MENISNIVLYNDGELELKISLNEETIWHRQDEISLLFNVDRTSITKHLNGEISVKNDTFIKNNTAYFGAKFTILLPINLQKN